MSSFAFREPATAVRVASSALEQSPSVHRKARSANPMSLPPIVIVTMSVVERTARICVAMTLAVVAPEQATKRSDVFGRCSATRYGYA